MVPFTSAAGLDAEFNSIDLNVTPRIQGRGGEIIVSATANFFGGCCYHLYAYDIAADLEVPENINITSPLPNIKDEIDAKPGGVATTTRFQWRVMGFIPADYVLNVTVSTRNCGSISESINIKITEGASVSNPDIYPQQPSVKEAISISVEAKTGQENVDVEDITLYTIISKNEYDLEDLSAKQDTIFIKQTSNRNNEQDPIVTLGIKGKAISMESADFTDKWRTTFSGFEKEGEVYFWFVVESTDGKNSTSGIYTLTIVDLEQRGLILNTVAWATILGTIIGIILIFTLWPIVLKKFEKTTGKKGFLSLGGKFYKEPYSAVTPEAVKLQKRLNALRNTVLIFFIIVTVVFIVWAINSDIFGDLFSRTLEG